MGSPSDLTLEWLFVLDLSGSAFHSVPRNTLTLFPCMAHLLNGWAHLVIHRQVKKGLIRVVLISRVKNHHFKAVPTGLGGELICNGPKSTFQQFIWAPMPFKIEILWIVLFSRGSIFAHFHFKTICGILNKNAVHPP